MSQLVFRSASELGRIIRQDGLSNSGTRRTGCCNCKIHGCPCVVSPSSSEAVDTVSDPLPGAHDRTEMSTELDPLVLVDRFSKRRPAPSVRGRRAG
jgi:hypothetical protein